MRTRNAFALVRPIGAFVASQLGHPRGWFGRSVMTRVLNRGNRELIVETLARLPLDESTRLLDVGFGGGLGLELARARGVVQLIGVDLSIDAVTHVRETSRAWRRGATLDLRVGSMLALPLESGAVDALLSTNTLYFLDELEPAFVELHRVLAPGGALAIGFSSATKLEGFGTITQHGFRLRPNETILAAAVAAGFADARLDALSGHDTRGDFVLVARRS